VLAAMPRQYGRAAFGKLVAAMAAADLYTATAKHHWITFASLYRHGDDVALHCTSPIVLLSKFILLSKLSNDPHISDCDIMTLVASLCTTWLPSEMMVDGAVVPDWSSSPTIFCWRSRKPAAVGPALTRRPLPYTQANVRCKIVSHFIPRPPAWPAASQDTHAGPCDGCVLIFLYRRPNACSNSWQPIRY